jgi:hypothetical protein
MVIGNGNILTTLFLRNFMISTFTFGETNKNIDKLNYTIYKIIYNEYNYEN